MNKLLAASAALLLLLSCSPETITASKWRAMSHEDRVIYVNTLIGEERSKDAKGGQGRTYTRSAEEYVTRIDAAYAKGDARDPQQIFAELAE